jgi:hypothetical protein
VTVALYSTIWIALTLFVIAQYGLRWGGGVFVNYLFVAVWAVDTWRSYIRGDRAEIWGVRFTLRLFYAMVIVNAAVVFAHWPMRIVGVCLVIALVVAWSRVRRV